MKKLLICTFLIFGLCSCSTNNKDIPVQSVVSDNKEIPTQTVVANNQQPDKTNLTSLNSKPVAENKTVKDYYIFPDSDKKLLTKEDIYLLSDFTLKLAKNEIFARKGYIFKDANLAKYFSNMNWYKQNTATKGTFEELNKTESANVKFIDDYRKSIENDYDYSSFLDLYEKTTKNGEDCYIQKISKDLDGDGVLEKIEALFYFENYNQNYVNIYNCIIEVTNEKGDKSSIKFYDNNIIPCLKFANFDVSDNLFQFYMEAWGPSGDPNTQIYSYDGKQIIENIHMVGFVTRYDGISKLYSFEEYSVNCYFDLNKGVTPLPKENIVGTTIKRGNIELFKKPTGYTVVITSQSITEPYYKYEGEFKDDYIGVVKEDTPLLVTDIEFKSFYDENELYYVPWIKVKTPQNVEGWFCLVYGD